MNKEEIKDYLPIAIEDGVIAKESYLAKYSILEESYKELSEFLYNTFIKSDINSHRELILNQKTIGGKSYVSFKLGKDLTVAIVIEDRMGIWCQSNTYELFKIKNDIESGIDINSYVYYGKNPFIENIKSKKLENRENKVEEITLEYNLRPDDNVVHMEEGMGVYETPMTTYCNPEHEVSKSWAMKYVKEMKKRGKKLKKYVRFGDVPAYESIKYIETDTCKVINNVTDPGDYNNITCLEGRRICEWEGRLGKVMSEEIGSNNNNNLTGDYYLILKLNNRYYSVEAPNLSYTNTNLSFREVMFDGSLSSKKYVLRRNSLIDCYGRKKELELYVDEERTISKELTDEEILGLYDEDSVWYKNSENSQTNTYSEEINKLLKEKIKGDKIKLDFLKVSKDPVELPRVCYPLMS